MNPSHNWGGRRPGAGRPRKPEKPAPPPRRPRGVSLDELELLYHLGAKQIEIAASFGISVRSLQRLTKKHRSVRAARERGRCRRQLDVLVALWQRSQTSDRILIFLAQWHLGWRTT